MEQHKTKIHIRVETWRIWEKDGKEVGRQLSAGTLFRHTFRYTIIEREANWQGFNNAEIVKTCSGSVGFRPGSRNSELSNMLTRPTIRGSIWFMARVRVGSRVRVYNRLDVSPELGLVRASVRFS